MFFKRKQENRQAAVNPSPGSGVVVSAKLANDQALSSEFILSAIEDGVVMVGKDNIIYLFNPAAATVTGWPANEAVGLDFHSVLSLVDAHGVPYPPEAHPFAKALQGGTTVRDSKAYLSTRGHKYMPVSLIVSPVLEADGSPPNKVVGVFRDITVEKLEESRRSEFVSTASHEMRTPIAAIEGYLSLVLNPKVAVIDERAKNYLEKARLATQHLGELFADLLTSSKAEDGRLASYPSAVEIGEIVEQVADSARFNAGKKGLELKYVISSDNEVRGGKVVRPLFYVFVDPNRMLEVLQNLIDNAIKYTSSGTITLALTGDQSVVQIQVRDTGAGIPEEDIPHLFQKFYRVDSSMTRNIGGTGLGLFICRRLVEMYNGRIWVESQLGKGSTFFINLPRLSAEQALEKQQTHVISPIKPL
ncbi:PAS domain-containing sensor histidine kinase [Candidatus Saccharibacteria bacterium]|nr:PAS domain-containing sensor histidine kinase [Candidatus Saccharibacteria bacterium]